MAEVFMWGPKAPRLISDVRGKLIVPETNAYESKPIVIAEARLLKAFSI